MKPEDFDKLDQFELVKALGKLDDISLMRANFYGEARFAESHIADEIGEWIAIGGVVMTRKKSPRWGNTIKDVILEKGQFSWLNKKDPNCKIVWDWLCKGIGRQWREMGEIAEAVLDNRYVDETFSCGANHYVANWFYFTAPSDHWCKKMKITNSLGGHIFLTDGKP